tara:strand:- start:17 stop:400 length:384 start_codon:yes stop_codon:yes gene_type:complete
MAKMIDRTAESETYFFDNWTQTEILIEDDSVPLDTTGLETYIKLQYINTRNELAGFGRQFGFGAYQVFCYHKVKKLSATLSDDVKAFFDCKVLPLDIHIGIGVQGEVLTLDNGFYLTIVQFPISQYS